jgi:hypothetical protein
MILLGMATKPKVIKVSELKKRKAQIEKDWVEVYGFSIYNQTKNHELGGHDSLGGDYFNDWLETLSRIDELKRMIQLCRQLHD